MFNFIRHYKSSPFHTTIRIHLISCNLVFQFITFYFFKFCSIEQHISVNVQTAVQSSHHRDDHSFSVE